MLRVTVLTLSVLITATLRLAYVGVTAEEMALLEDLDNDVVIAVRAKRSVELLLRGLAKETLCTGLAVEDLETVHHIGKRYSVVTLRPLVVLVDVNKNEELVGLVRVGLVSISAPCRRLC